MIQESRCDASHYVAHQQDLTHLGSPLGLSATSARAIELRILRGHLARFARLLCCLSGIHERPYDPRPVRRMRGDTLDTSAQTRSTQARLDPSVINPEIFAQSLHILGEPCILPALDLGNLRALHGSRLRERSLRQSLSLSGSLDRAPENKGIRRILKRRRHFRILSAHSLHYLP